MLYPATVEPATLGLLTRLMQVPPLESFALAGGPCSLGIVYRLILTYLWTNLFLSRSYLISY
jgi:hypothetical protein